MLGLSEKDKEFLASLLEKKVKKVVKEELQEALTAFLVREITVEKGPRKQGDSEKRIEKESVNVLDWMCYYIPLIEGAIRGSQQDMNKVTNKSAEMGEQIQVIGNILVGHEDTVKQIAQFAQKLDILTDNIKSSLQLTNESGILIIDGEEDESHNTKQ